MLRRFLAAAALVVASPVALAAVVAGPMAPDAPVGGAEEGATLARGDLPATLLPVYRGAAATCPGLPWEVLAAIGWLESRHGQGRVHPHTGDVDPPIIGPAIDGRPGFALIRDPSQADGYAHALGPMQFLSTTWARWRTLAPERPVGAAPDVHNAWDAIYAAARYLCGGRARLADLRAAILSYNRSEAYLRDVLERARTYGVEAGG